MNCSFNIRYKPRTTRAFTKSDLTVYDSAGNTALNTLTVYGKSEVVDGSIKSAGEGWATVDLGTLTFILRGTDQPNYNSFKTTINNIDAFVSQSQPPKLMCGKFKSVAWNADWQPFIMSMLSTDATSVVFTTPKTVTTVEQFQALISDVILAYQSTQGNCIAVKTDDGTGIDGTMATFSTGTPLRGIPDTTVRDVMVWDGSSGEVTKKCGDVDLGTLNWTYSSSAISLPTFGVDISDLASTESPLLCALYTSKINRQYIDGDMQIARWNNTGSKTILITNSNYTDATDFKTAMSGVKLIYELATPTMQPLSSTENASLAALRTFEPQTHAQNNAGAEMTVDYTIIVPTI